MRSLVFEIVDWAGRQRTLVVVAVVCGLAVSLLGMRRVSFDADVLSLLPRDGAAARSFARYLAQFGTLDELYVVLSAPEGHAVSDYREEIDDWVHALRGAPEIVRVDTGLLGDAGDLEWLAARQLLLLRDDALAEALGRLQPAGLARAVAATRELLTVPSADVTRLVQQDPAGLFPLLREALGGNRGGAGSDPIAGGFVTADGRSRLIVARPRHPPYDTTFAQALDSRLREIERHVRASAEARRVESGDELPPLDVALAGGHRIAVETEDVVWRESLLNTIVPLALILPLLFLVFRSPWLVAVGALPSGLSLLVVLGVLGFAGARLSWAATGSAAMLFGLGIDGVVLLYVAHLLRDAGDAVAPSLAGPSTSMLLGMWTTAATFYGLAVVDFPSLQQVGLLIGHSMMVCGLLTLVLVPALLPRSGPRRPPRRLVLMGLAGWVGRFRGPIIAASIVLTVALGYAALGLDVNPTLDRLRSVTAAALLEERIADTFGLPADVYVVLAEGPELEPLLEANERLDRRLSSELPDVTIQAPTRLLPSARSQRETAERIARAGLSPEEVRLSLESARVASGFRPGTFDAFAARLPHLLDASERLTYDGFIAHRLGPLLERFIAREEGRWLLATYLLPDGAVDVAAMAAMVERAGDGLTLTGLPIVNGELARRFVPEFGKGVAIGSAMVVALVALAFRSWRLSLFALLPTAVGLVWAAGLLALLGVELDLFAVFAVVTFLGIGVDYGIHLVHRYRERGDAARATGELAPVILVAAAITFLGYGTLVTSSYPPLRSIGIVSAVSVATLAAASLLMLPALLSLGKRP